MNRPPPANGVSILILGILSMVGLGALTGIPGWIIGRNALRDIKLGYADPAEQGMVTAGMVLSIVGTLSCAVGIVSMLLFFGVLSAMFIHPVAPGH